MTFLHFLLIYGEKDEGRVDLCTIRDLIEDTIVSTKPAMMVNLMACTAGASAVSHSSQCHSCASNTGPKTLLRAETRAAPKA